MLIENSISGYYIDQFFTIFFLQKNLNLALCIINYICVL